MVGVLPWNYYRNSYGVINIAFINGDIIMTLKTNLGEVKDLNRIEDTYNQRKIKWVADPYAKLEIRNDGNLVVYSSDISGQLGYIDEHTQNRVIWG